MPATSPCPGTCSDNGDGTIDIAIYRRSIGGWEVAGITSDDWGLPGDVARPLPYAISNSFFPPPRP